VGAGTLQDHTTTTSQEMDIKTKLEFVHFIKRAVSSTSDDCYIELYNLLLRCFVAADTDMDGKVDGKEFSGMIEGAAALPRNHGFQWWEDTEEKRTELFNKIDDNNDGAISFDEWLSFVINKYTGLSASLPAVPDEMDGSAYSALCKGGSTAGSEEAKVLYFLHWKSFQAADSDRDGKVSEGEFDLMINFLTATPKKLGLSLPPLSADDRKSMFAAMDANGDGAISFDEWLDFSMKTIIAGIQ